MHSLSCRTKPNTSLTLPSTDVAAPLADAGERRPFPSPCLAAARWSTTCYRDNALKLGEGCGEDHSRVQPP
jgi:hypothetical protein